VPGCPDRFVDHAARSRQLELCGLTRRTSRRWCARGWARPTAPVGRSPAWYRGGLACARRIGNNRPQRVTDPGNALVAPQNAQTMADVRMTVAAFLRPPRPSAARKTSVASGTDDSRLIDAENVCHGPQRQVDLMDSGNRQPWTTPASRRRVISGKPPPPPSSAPNRRG